MPTLNDNPETPAEPEQAPNQFRPTTLLVWVAIMRRWLRFRLRTLLLAVTVLSVGVGTYAIVWPAWKERQRVESPRTLVLEAKNSLEAGKVYHNLLKRAQRSSLARLQEDDNIGIALMAAYQPIIKQNERWQEADESDTQGERPKARRREIHQALATEFLKFFEERTALDAPEWWKKAARDGWYYDYNDPVSYPDLLSIENGAVVLADGQQLTLSPEALAELKDPVLGLQPRECTALIDGDSAYVAAIDYAGSLSRIIRIERKTGELIWRADNWAFGFENMGAHVGVVSHNAAVTLQDGVVAVWGESFSNIYLEAFDAETGKSKYRFTTNLWFAR